MARHKHYDAIVAWAEGKEIQCRHPNDAIWTAADGYPKWYNDLEYRVKPEVIKFRNYLWKNGNTLLVHSCTSSDESYSRLERYDGFIRWLGEEQTVEV